MKTKSFDELRKRMTPKQRAESETLAQLALLYLNLAELQESLGITADNMVHDIDIRSVFSHTNSLTD